MGTCVASKEPTLLWRGHPQVRYEIAEGRVLLTEEWEYPPAPENLAEVTATVEQLAHALADVRLEIERFCVQLELLTGKLTEDAAAARVMARSLCGLPE